MNNIPYSFHEKYVLRTPAISILELEKINSSQSLKDLLRNPFISESIYLTSPELHQEMQKHLEEGSFLDNKIESTLVKFILRMCYRATPFGLFAGISLGTIMNKDTNIELNSIDKYQRKTRLDMNYLCSLAQNIEANKNLQTNLLYYPNSSIYKIGDEYRYIEYKYVDTVRNHYMISVAASEYIEKILALSVNGAKIKELAKTIISNQISIQQAEDFITSLIDNQILISEISPSVTGNSYLDFISNKTNTPWLKDLNSLVEKLDYKLVNEDLKQYKAIIKTLENHKVPFNKKFLFQTDLLVTTKSNVLENKVIKDIKKSLVVLNKLKKQEKNPILEDFKKAFYERYEDEEVPLYLALDVETGIGYDQNLKNSYDVCPLVDDLIMSNNFNTTITDDLENNAFLYKKLENAQNNNLYEIIIDDNDVKNEELNWTDLPETFPIMASIFKDESLEHIVAFDHVGGSTSNFLIGRFGHVNNKFETLLKEITLEEKEKKDIILAEIVHLPESRTGNIIYRPQIRNYEIPYLAKSNLPIENQISLSDIYISIVNDNIILKSKKLNKYIEPRMANAHAYWAENTLPIYHLLCDLQGQNKRRYLDFSWSNRVKNNRFLPRVRYKNIIFSRAQWSFQELNINNFDSLMDWKKKENIPNSFFLLHNENELFIDLNKKICCDIFLKEIKNSPIVTIKESLYNDFTSVVKHNDAYYANEFMFFLKKNDSNVK